MKKKKSKKNDARISHKDLLAKIGEIDGISLENQKDRISVFLWIDGKKISLIQESCEIRGMIDHHITRIGISELLCGRG